MAPSLSVVIPTLNAAGEIDELLTLIEAQTLVDFRSQLNTLSR